MPEKLLANVVHYFLFQLEDGDNRSFGSHGPMEDYLNSCATLDIAMEKAAEIAQTDDGNSKGDFHILGLTSDFKLKLIATKAFSQRERNRPNYIDEWVFASVDKWVLALDKRKSE